MSGAPRVCIRCIRTRRLTIGRASARSQSIQSASRGVSSDSTTSTSTRLGASRTRSSRRELAFIESCKADGIDLPIVIHCREAFDDLLPILRETTLDRSRFVFHCFTGNPDDARMVLDFGAMISFTGVVTYKNAKDVAEAAKIVPRDRILIETDAPFLSPDPKRGTWPCVPAYARYTAEFVAKIRGESFPDFHEQLDANTESFFGIEVPKPDPEIIARACTC